MKGKIFNIIAFALSGLFLTTCGSTPQTQKMGGPYYEGNGGKGMRLGILAPQSQGLNESQAYLPTVVQGVLVSNMSKYSAISVLDRVALDKIITETLDPTYEDNWDIVRLGHVAQVSHMMTSRIIRTSTGYTLQINVSDTTPNANTIASYSGTCTVAQLENQSATQQASAELLTQMGVQLTASARNELNKANSQQQINAQTSLAQGIMAQRKGQTVEAISYYFDASAFDSTATEAINRMSVATTTIATGSLGNQVRNDIQQRNEWIKLIDETKKFFIDNPQYNIVEMVYDQRLDLGTIDYTSERALLKFPVQVRLNTEKANAIVKILTDIENGLNATGRKQQWGINLSLGKDLFVFAYTFDFELLNERGKVIVSATTDPVGLLGPPFSLTTYQTYDSHAGRRKGIWENYWRIPDYPESRGEFIAPMRYDVVGHVSIQEMRDQIIKQLSGNDYLRFYRLESAKIKSSFSGNWVNDPGFSVKASDITDGLTIRLKNISVYRFVDKHGHSVMSNGYRRIRQGSNIIPVRVENINLD